MPATDCTVSAIGSRLRCAGAIELSFVPSLRSSLGTETELMKGGLALWVLATSCVHVVLEEVLHGTLSMILDGGDRLIFDSALS